MTTEIIILLFAGLLKAVKDRLDDPKDRYGNYFTGHVFPKDGKLWNKGTGKSFLGFYFDAWHICDWLYISCFCVLLNLHYHLWEAIGHWNSLLYFLITQFSFNLFYFIFKRK